MTLPILTLPPEKSGYSVSFAPSTLRAGFGGLGRYRRIPQEAPTVNATWRLSGDDFERFMVFHNVTIERGATPFQVDLILDSPYPERRVVFLVPGSLGIRSVAGDTFNITASLRVK